MRINIYIWLFFLPVGIFAQKSPFNGLVADSLRNNYSFIVSGHFHGSSQNVSGFPAASLLAGLDLINNGNAHFLCSTGDLFMDVRANIPQYKRALFNKLKIPMYNAVGNHDISSNVYQENFGSTWFSFSVGTELFIFLDTEQNDGSIKGDQLEFFSATLKKYAGRIRNVMIFSHRPVWAEDHPQLKTLFLENTHSDFGNNYTREILPLIEKYKGQQVFYWFSGSLGGNAPASFFYHKQDASLYYIQSAIRDLPRDGFLEVKVDNGRISFETVSLTVEKMPTLESCDVKMWERKPVEGFNYRLVPLYLKQMIFHRYFWYGIGYTLVGVLILYFIRKRSKRKKIA